ncbi:MAG: 1-acyl-sn-glycerol-3-phosphate acyltransferase [Chloroflexi bacterium]|nr:1-acyl-sn-glycerol-3-phosphate acyltransferase [Chloroflexota bacterium]
MTRVDFTYGLAARAMAAVMTLCRVRWRVLDAGMVPRTGPLIVVANHLSFLDPPVLVASSPRRLVFLAKEELTHHPGSALVLWAMGALTVRRGHPDRAALRAALDALRQGQAVCIFPEGTRSRRGTLRPGHAGAVLLAQWSGAPLLPAAVWGTEAVRLPWGLVTRPALTVRFGPPFTLSLERGQDGARPALAEATATMMRHIAALLPERHRGAYPTPAARSDAPGPGRGTGQAPR